MGGFGDAFGAFAAGLAPGLAQVADRKERNQLRLTEQRRADEEQLLKMLESSEDPEKRALAVAARLERATRKPGAKGKSILDSYVSGPNNWREHPAFQQVGEIAGQIGSMGDELANMGPQGQALNQAGAGANRPVPGQGMELPAPPPGPETAQASTLATGAPTNGAPPPLAQFSGSPSVAGAGHLNPQAVGAAAADTSTAPTPPPGPESVGASAPRFDPYAQTLEQGFRPDVLGGFGPMGDQAFKANLQGQVTEKQRFSEDQRAKRERDKALASERRLDTQHQNRLAEIRERGGIQKAIAELQTKSREKVAGIRGKGAGSGGNSSLFRWASTQRMGLDKELTNDLQALDREERQALQRLENDNLLRYDTVALQRRQDQIRRDFDRAREDNRSAAEQLRTQLDAILGGPPGPAAGQGGGKGGGAGAQGGAGASGGSRGQYRFQGKTYTWDQLPEAGKAAARAKGVAPQ